MASIRRALISFFCGTLCCFANAAAAETPELSVPQPVFDENTPVNLGALTEQKMISGIRPWRAPDFSHQTQALGWKPEAFDVPKGLEKQVQFWIDIYTRYSTSQGLVHDAEYVDLIYEVVDFSELERGGLSAHLREKAKRQMVEDAKTRAFEVLRQLSSLSSPKGLTPAELRIWNYFGGDSTKIREAMQGSRFRFQLGQKDRMETAIYLSGRYLEDFERIFRENGLPIELTRLVFVESSFNVLARSKVGASGLWQLMPATVRPHRLMTAAVDNRNHPPSATRVAARVLQDNFNKLNNWPLAVTGYNHGPNGVRKMVESTGNADLVALIRDVQSRRSFGFASKNFYASFMAALEVERNAKRYFPGIVWSKPLESEDFKLPQPIKYADLLSWFNNDDEKTQIYNPHLTTKVRKHRHSIPQGTLVAVPKEKYSHALLALGHRDRKMASLKASGSQSLASNALRTHKVARGENLTEIAKEYEVSLKQLLLENEMSFNDRIVPGQVLKIPQ